MRLGLLVVALLLSPFAQAETSYRIGTQVLVVGDSAVRTLQLLGQPTFREPMQNDYGAYRGERWQYVEGDKTLIVIINQGRVDDIEEVHN